MRPFGVEDLSRQVALGQVALDPAGELAVYTRRTVVDGRDRIDLWTVPVAGGVPRALTDGPAWDTQPRFSPDGRLIAFLSARGDDPGQLHVIAREGAMRGRSRRSRTARATSRGRPTARSSCWPRTSGRRAARAT